MKSLNDVSPTYEEQMFAHSDDEVKLFVRANELVHIPFKYQSFTSYGVTPEMVSDNSFLYNGYFLFENVRLFDFEAGEGELGNPM